MSEKLQKSLRLRKKETIKNIFAKGKRLSYGNLLLFFVPNNANYSRVVIIVSKKKLPKAINRVLFRRTVREIFRKYHEALQHVDIAILPKNGMQKLTRQEINQCTRKSLTKLIPQLKQ